MRMWWMCEVCLCELYGKLYQRSLETSLTWKVNDTVKYCKAISFLIRKHNFCHNFRKIVTKGTGCSDALKYLLDNGFKATKTYKSHVFRSPLTRLSHSSFILICESSKRLESFSFGFLYRTENFNLGFLRFTLFVYNFLVILCLKERFTLLPLSSPSPTEYSYVPLVNFFLI